MTDIEWVGHARRHLDMNGETLTTVDGLYAIAEALDRLTAAIHTPASSPSGEVGQPGMRAAGAAAPLGDFTHPSKEFPHA